MEAGVRRGREGEVDILQGPQSAKQEQELFSDGSHTKSPQSSATALTKYFSFFSERGEGRGERGEERGERGEGSGGEGRGERREGRGDVPHPASPQSWGHLKQSSPTNGSHILSPQRAV